MEKYMHQMDNTPNVGEYVLVFKKGKSHKMILVDENTWLCAKPLYDTWCYINDIIHDIKIIGNTTNNPELLKIAEEASNTINK